jgi:hypothetical protein
VRACPRARPTMSGPTVKPCPARHCDRRAGARARRAHRRWRPAGPLTQGSTGACQRPHGMPRMPASGQRGARGAGGQPTWVATRWWCTRPVASSGEMATRSGPAAGASASVSRPPHVHRSGPCTHTNLELPFIPQPPLICHQCLRLPVTLHPTRSYLTRKYMQGMREGLLVKQTANARWQALLPARRPAARRRTRRAVGEHQQRDAVVDRGAGLAADAVERRLQAGRALGRGPGRVQRGRAPAAVVHALERVQLRRPQDRLLQLEPARKPRRVCRPCLRQRKRPMFVSKLALRALDILAFSIGIFSFLETHESPQGRPVRWRCTTCKTARQPAVTASRKSLKTSRTQMRPEREHGAAASPRGAAAAAAAGARACAPGRAGRCR